MKKIFTILTLGIIAFVSIQEAYAFTPISNGDVASSKETVITETELSTNTTDYTLVHSKIVDANMEWYVYEALNEDYTHYVVVKNPTGGYMPANDLYYDSYLLLGHAEVQTDVTVIVRIESLSSGNHTITMKDTYDNLSQTYLDSYGYVVVEGPISYDLSLLDLTDGDSLTQEQDDFMTQMLNGTTDVTLSYGGTDYTLSYRQDVGISPGITELDVVDGVGGWRIWYDSGNIYIKDDTGAVPTGTFSLGMFFPPTISGEGVYLSDYDNPATIADVQATLTATDDPDGDLTSSIIVFEDNYTGNENVLGNHTITFEVEDAAGNRSQFIVTVQVVDITAAIITLNGATEITKGIGDAPCSYPGAYATDNVDGADIQLDGVCNVDTSVVGTYTIEFDYTDSSGNVSDTVIVTVNVEDTESPYVQSNVTSITTYNSQNLTINSVLSGITVIDDHDLTFDGSYTVTVDNYTGNESVEGSYDVTIEATDASGNVMTHTITIVVIDDLPPVISATDYLLTSAEVAAMSQAEIKAHIESRTQ